MKFEYGSFLNPQWPNAILGKEKNKQESVYKDFLTARGGKLPIDTLHNPPKVLWKLAPFLQ